MLKLHSVLYHRSAFQIDCFNFIGGKKKKRKKKKDKKRKKNSVTEHSFQKQKLKNLTLIQLSVQTG